MSFVQHGTRMLLLTAILRSHQYFQELLSTTVPEAYLDEVFHIPQAQRYWARKWTEWDSKITTPPALYLWSYLFHSARRRIWIFGNSDAGGSSDLSTGELRYSNAVFLPLSIIVFVSWTFVAGRYPKNSGVVVLPREFVMTVFPLYFFFSGLYYTDLFSALSVVVTCVTWEGSVRSRSRWKLRLFCQFLHLAFGLLSLASRQTNVFWVAVFLGGLQVVDSVKSRVGAEKVHDLEVGNAWLEAVSLLSNGIHIIPSLILDLWPQLTLLFTFGTFVVWNGGVVLGDKSNHIATIHIPQMLYIWPFITFFSWPVLLPYIISTLNTTFTNQAGSKQTLPRPWILVVIMMMMALAVHFNTIVHPFTLADNRHFTFYVFRLLILQPAFPGLKYAVVPVYAICAWLVLGSLTNPTLPAISSSSSEPTTVANTSDTTTSPKTKTKTTISKKQEKRPKREQKGKDSDTDIGKEVSLHKDEKVNEQRTTETTSSLVLIWLASTTLSLITAPLVEPRYFIVPWLIWRLHVPYNHLPAASATTSSNSLSSNQPSSNRNTNETIQNIRNKQPKQTTLLQNILHFIAQHAIWIELTWYMAINISSIYIFLYWGFEWVQEPKTVQRFMW